MAIGRAKDQVHGKKPVVKTKYSMGRNLYSLINVGKISVNNTVIRQTESLGFHGIFIDSGSTLTYF